MTRQSRPTSMEEEVEALSRERDLIRRRIGSIGGARWKRLDTVINVVLLVVVVGLFVLEVGFHVLPEHMSLEIGVLLVSIKLVLVMTSLQRVSHYEFWILNTIDFRLSQMEASLRSISASSPSASDRPRSSSSGEAGM